MSKKTKLIITIAVLLACYALIAQFLPSGEAPAAELPLLTPAPQEAALPAQPEEQPTMDSVQVTGAQSQGPEEGGGGPAAPEAAIAEDGVYDSKEDVALYIHTYGKLPSNYITKDEARKLGWEGGSVEDYAPGMCIGGDYFGNYEGILPDGNYTECDIDTLGYGSRGSRRIVFSDDGRIYYTHDHYESFEQLY